MFGLKSLFCCFAGSKDDYNEPETSSPKSEQQLLSHPLLDSGSYGNFPAAFSVYFAGPSRDKKSDFYLLATDGDETMAPLNAFATHKGMSKHQLTLYSGPTVVSAPLSLAGNEKFFRSTSLIALPSPIEGSTNQIQRLESLKTSKMETFSFNFPIKQEIETFEWRSDSVLQSEKEKPFERWLMRKTLDDDEIVARWLEEDAPETEGRLGIFCFQGSGLTGELGPSWALMVVMSLMRVNQARWDATVARGGMKKAAARLKETGIDLGTPES